MTKLYDFALKSLYKNPHFEEGLKVLDRDGEVRPFRSCLISDNDAPFLLKTNPKWLSCFHGSITDTETGEIDEDVIYHSDDMNDSVKRKRKAIKKFADHFEPLYQARKVSVFFITLTRSNCATTDIRTLLNVYLKRFKKRKISVLGYLWVSEVTEGYHWHYHIALAIPRVKWKSIPNWIKPNVIWGQRTRIEFVKKSVAAYLGKYISKDNIGRMHNFRGYAVSRKFLDIPH